MMKYPEFLKKGDLIGICAPSAGIGRKLESFDRSLGILRAEGYRIKETASVRLDSDRGGSAQTRGDELNTLFVDPEVKMVMAASGGDFLDEMLPYADFEQMKRNPKWLMGASDPTGLLFPYTTICDVATLYGCNAGSYDLPDSAGMQCTPGSDGCQLQDDQPAPGNSRTGQDDRQPQAIRTEHQTGLADESRYLRDNLRFLKGENPVQETSEKHLGCAPFLAERIQFDTPTVWKSNTGAIHTTGRCIGGCIDVLKDLIGTPYDGASLFVDRYGEKDGIIWYFDNFALSAEMLYRTFLQMKYAGWFRFTKAVLLGRTLFEKSESGMTYDEAVEWAFGGVGQKEMPGSPQIPVIWEADIGHTIPHMTMINGAILRLDYEGGRGTMVYQEN
ncbi:S66 family peptidase [Porcincola intestinalis]|uniref:S66 family peptidase n=1 Tax=Porcincola intestinalis TaxID=2606632 RepID=UPI0023F0C468|nr:S66 peptidase family protein [Porcincola intestinalis]MCI6767730.1 LD-carboxypeptidase [Lachnospiraceae bacterium]MDD7060408.1 LD-carboxypeptidase [Porcincola intestinalis]MDY5282428.1 LD-carboxypeptidase [Porcincola intestinalis]